MNLLNYDPWVLNWSIINLPSTVVLIPSSCLFHFIFILFWINTLLLFLYPKHVRKLLGYISGCYRLEICFPLALALGNGAGEGSIHGSLVIPVTVVTFGICMCETSR